MLVLCREPKQTIMIGDDIEIMVVDVRGGKVRLGIKAPAEVSVHRKEVWAAIQRENRAAALVRPEDLGRTLGGRRDPPEDGPATSGVFARRKKPPGGLSGRAEPPRSAS